MTEQINGEIGPKTPEKNEDQLYKELMENLNEQDRLIKEMGIGEVENIQKLMAQMDDLIKTGNAIWKAYKQATEKSREQEKV